MKNQRSKNPLMFAEIFFLMFMRNIDLVGDRHLLSDMILSYMRLKFIVEFSGMAFLFHFSLTTLFCSHQKVTE